MNDITGIFVLNDWKKEKNVLNPKVYINAQNQFNCNISDMI